MVLHYPAGSADLSESDRPSEARAFWTGSGGIQGSPRNLRIAPERSPRSVPYPPGVARVVVIEDEEPIAAAVAARLRSEGFEVEVAADGPSGVALVERARPDLVVLDLMLPGFDGLEVCRRIQKDRPGPVLMLTARDSETDLLVGLAVGADDYLTKPFSPRELVARVHAILRRVGRAADSAAADPAGRTLRLGRVALEPATRLATLDGEPVHLTPTESGILALLGDHPRVVS